MIWALFINFWKFEVQTLHDSLPLLISSCVCFQALKTRVDVFTLTAVSAARLILVHEIFRKSTWKLICTSEVCFSLLSQIPVEPPSRRILISNISAMTKFRARCSSERRGWSFRIDGSLLGIQLDHTHTLIAASDWIFQGCLDCFHCFHANWWR